MQFDRFLAPGTIIRQSVCVQASSATPGGPLDQCIGGLSPEYDPVDRVAVWKGAALQPNQRYNVRVLAPKNDDDPNGIRAFDGVALTDEYIFAFTTGDGTTPSTEPNRAVTFCSHSAYCPLPGTACATPTPDSTVQGPNDLLRTCAVGAQCHGQPSPELTVTAGSVLPLTDGANGGVPSAVKRLVDNGIVATETAVGPDPGAPQRGPNSPFGVNMPYIDANNPGNSYMIYKLLLATPPRCTSPNEESAQPEAAMTSCMDGKYGYPEGVATDVYPCKDIVPTPAGPGGACPIDGGAPPPQNSMVVAAGSVAPPIAQSWVPDADWKPPIEGEFARLRSHVRGDAMPPPNGPTGRQNILALSAWIAAGAQTTSCP